MTAPKAFSAPNAKILCSQLDAAPDDFIFNFGHQKKGVWFAHSDFGSMLKTGLTFAEVVEYANYLFELYRDRKDGEAAEIYDENGNPTTA